MRDALNVRSAVVLGIIAAALLGGCSESGTSPASNGGTSGGATSTGNGTPGLVFISGVDLHHLDPQQASWMQDFRVIECLWETLLRVELPSERLAPAAAERYEVSDDGRTYTFHLRPDARWSDGSPLTAADFVRGWRRAMMPDLAAQYTSSFFVIEGAPELFRSRTRQLEAYIKDPASQSKERAEALFREAVAFGDEHVGLRAADDKTLVVTLKEPLPYFTELVGTATFSPIHPSVDRFTRMNPATGMQTLDVAWFEPGNLVTNGPYVLTARRAKRDLTMRPNPHYWNRSALKNGGIRMDIIENAQTALLAYQRGLAHWWPDLPSGDPLAADLLAQNRPDIHPYTSAGTYFYIFNCLPSLPDGQPNPLADARVRRALALTIDRRTITEKVTRLNQPIASVYIPPGCLPGYTPPSQGAMSFDPEAARRLLAEAGYPGGAGVTGLSILFNQSAGHDRIAEQIANTWKRELGVPVTLEVQDSKVFGDRLRNQKYAIARASWFGDYRDATTFLYRFTTGDGNNDGKWSSPAFDDLLQRADSISDPGQRLAMLAQAEGMILSDAAIAPIYHYVQFYLHDPAKVKGLYENPWGFRRLEFVEVAK